MQAVTLLLCLFNVAGILFYTPIPNVSPRASVAILAVLFAIIVSVSFVVIWFFWQGKDWARWLVIATSVLAILNLLSLGSANAAQMVLVLLEAALGVWLLYWLNTERVAAFFKRAGTGCITLSA
jgi:hypothetical protein